MAEAPHFMDHELYQLLRAEHVQEFNERRAAGDEVDLRGSNLRGTDLRGLEADGLDLSNVYLRGADLRGIDLRNTQIGGASIRGAKISGVWFPDALSAPEILMSFEKGTRLRYGM